MISFGRSLRWFNNYEYEIEFSKSNEFDFMQIWFQKGKLLIDNVDEPHEEYLNKYNFPLIIHAVFEMDDFETYGKLLLDLVQYFKHNKIIIHPIFPPSNSIITDRTIYELSKKIEWLYKIFNNLGIKIYIENNSKLDVVNYSVEDLKVVFKDNPDVELLLDIAHIDSYEHLESIIDVKYPKMLHIADKHFSTLHEHLPIGEGDLDFKIIFKKYLNCFEGDIILEIPESDDIIIDSFRKIKDALLCT